MLETFFLGAGALGLLAGIVCCLFAAFGRGPNDITLGLTLLTAGLMIVNLVLNVVQLAGGRQPVQPLWELWLYLICAVIIPLAGGVWALAERSKYSNLTLGIACLVTVVMGARVLQIWNGA